MSQPERVLHDRVPGDLRRQESVECWKKPLDLGTPVQADLKAVHPRIFNGS